MKIDAGNRFFVDMNAVLKQFQQSNQVGGFDLAPSPTL